MKMKWGKSARVWTIGFAACGILGCDLTGTGGDGADAGVDPDVAACKAGVEAKIAQLKAENVDVENWSFKDAPEMAELVNPGVQTPENYAQFDGQYRPLTNHPGCSVQNLYYDKSNTAGATPYTDGNNDGKWTANFLTKPNEAKNHIDGDVAKIPGYPCAAKEYAQPNEDTSKPIIILVQGNSTRPHTWEKFLLPSGIEINAALEKVVFAPDDTTARDQLAEKLIAERYRVIAVDLRTDVLSAIEPTADATTGNAAGNVDHGWSTPIVQSLVKAVMKNNPNRKVSLIGHSLGVTVARDAIRRMFVEFREDKEGAVNPFPQLHSMILGSGANHGVSNFESSAGNFCALSDTMKGTVVCEMGSRANYSQTYFHKPLNGPKDLFSTPCADGDYAFGTRGHCGENVVKYYTITMEDIEPGVNYQDFYVSQASSRLDLDGCVVNKLTTRSDYDTSGYFGTGFIANHFGSVRSAAGLNLVMDYLKK